MRLTLTVISRVLVLFLALQPAMFAMSTWYVNGVSGNDGNNCKSPTQPCKTIGHAISLASSGDTVMVASGTYNENLNIAYSLTIIGPAASTTILDGQQRGTGGHDIQRRRQSYSRQPNHPKWQGGRGGGINNSGTLTVNSSVLSGNVASLVNCHTPPCVAEGGGIDNMGTLTLNNTILRGNSATEQGAALGGAAGGGIYNFGGTVEINNTTLSGNTASFAQCQYLCGASGGAISSEGTLTINNSTVSRNSTSSDRHIRSSGGGIINLRSAAVNNSTITGNRAESAGGGIENPEGSTLTINNSTLNENSAADGGAIGSYMSTVILQNSIVANSPSGGNCSGTMTSTGYNLSSDGTCYFNGPGDMNNINPFLGPLKNNGGPTPTMALLEGSPAIDAANPLGCTDGAGHLLKTDQRGMPRPDKEDTGGCDMGAYERQSD